MADIAKQGARPWHWRLAIAGVIGAVVSSRWLGRATTPDDYDSFSFVLGMVDFDLTRFQPQFPGYPVYIGLGAAMCRALGMAPETAATIIAAVASGGTGLGLAACARALAGRGAAVAVLALHGVAWLPWFLGSSMLSEPLGMALAALALALLLHGHPGMSGACAGLLLGVRASYWPLVLSLAVLAWHRRRRRRFGLALGIGVLIWAAPFVVRVGAKPLLELGITHVQGHFSVWGGTLGTQPLLGARLIALARGVFFHGLAPSGPALGLCAAAVAWAAWQQHRRGVAARATGSPGPTHPPMVFRMLGLLAPYAVWVLVAQNILVQPRHVLPLVEALVLGLGCFLAQERVAVWVICAVMVAVNAPLIAERHRVPPAAAQAAAWLAQVSRSRANEEQALVIAAGRSARFFVAQAPRGAQASRWPRWIVREHLQLGGLLADVSRFSRLPRVIWVASDVDLSLGPGHRRGLPPPWQLRSGPHFCRDARLDPAQPCLGLSQLVWSSR